MEFIDLKTQYNYLKSDIYARIDKVLEQGQYILGPEVKELEDHLAAYVGVKHCVSVANGTDALMISMMALGIEPGDEVITSPFTFVANAEMIALLGAKPVFVDIDPRTYTIDANKIVNAITQKTKCIMPVSLYGQCADMDAINTIAEHYHLSVIEDAAQSFGATYKNKKSCSLSTIGCTSFFPSKPLGCYGDGGACFTDDDEIASAIRQIRVHGQDRRYHHKLIGVNSRLDTLQAAILLAKCTVFDEEIKQRIKIAQRYNSLLGSHVKTITVPSFHTCVYAQYTIEVADREDAQSYLKQNNVPTAIHYPMPLHLQTAFKYLNHIMGDYPVAESAAQSVMSLPMHPYLTHDDQDFIVRHLIYALEHRKERVME